MTEFEVSVFTDYNQFVVFDSHAEWGNDDWTDQAIEDMFIQGGGVHCRRHEAQVPCSRRSATCRRRPAGRTQHGTLSIPSGVLEVSGVTERRVG